MFPNNSCGKSYAQHYDLLFTTKNLNLLLSNDLFNYFFDLSIMESKLDILLSNDNIFWFNLFNNLIYFKYNRFYEINDTAISDNSRLIKLFKLENNSIKIYHRVYNNTSAPIFENSTERYYHLLKYKFDINLGITYINSINNLIASLNNVKLVNLASIDFIFEKTLDVLENLNNELSTLELILTNNTDKVNTYMRILNTFKYLIEPYMKILLCNNLKNSLKIESTT
jgi:hypothetical protein